MQSITDGFVPFPQERNPKFSWLLFASLFRFPFLLNFLVFPLILLFFFLFSLYLFLLLHRLSLCLVFFSPALTIFRVFFQLWLVCQRINSYLWQIYAALSTAKTSSDCLLTAVPQRQHGTASTELSSSCHPPQKQSQKHLRAPALSAQPSLLLWHSTGWVWLGESHGLDLQVWLPCTTALPSAGNSWTGPCHLSWYF